MIPQALKNYNRNVLKVLVPKRTSESDGVKALCANRQALEEISCLTGVARCLRHAAAQLL